MPIRTLRCNWVKDFVKKGSPVLAEIWRCHNVSLIGEFLWCNVSGLD